MITFYNEEEHRIRKSKIRIVKEYFEVYLDKQYVEKDTQKVDKIVKERSML